LRPPGQCTIPPQLPPAAASLRGDLPLHPLLTALLAALELCFCIIPIHRICSILGTGFFWLLSTSIAFKNAKRRECGLTTRLLNLFKLFTMACHHLESLGPSLRIPNATESVYREDCTQCFDSIVSCSFAVARNWDRNILSQARVNRLNQRTLTSCFCSLSG
jgi:hypothetical protein